ncbi:MAG: 30S ribosomal protein S12 methylthiotransferase RimO [Oscillospiraceae bacterium]|nr:30S ribosomal protein S12 methylthiotransferase RimO [Oscillospiraceae bacterium]
MNKKIGFISLGCPKNQVDSELMIKKLSDAGYQMIDTPFGADIVIINTCGFIEAAKQEAIDNIIEMGQYKEDGDVGKIIVIGCMAERYKDEILKEMPEVDAVAGLGINGDIVEFVNNVVNEEKKSEYPNKTALPLSGERVLTTPPHWAYLKISDGCSNCCSFCAIPLIRGPFRSRKIEDIVSEAKALADEGVKELIVIAQDTTRYGLDIYGRLMLPELLTQLSKIDDLRWIRLLYCYPDRITDELLTVMRDNEKILNYIDLPLQHASGRLLKTMNRTGDKESLTALINKIRSYMPDCVLRTTFITGFPGETDEDFDILSEFIDDIGFDRLGCFAFSPEEGTKAFDMENQVDPELASHRGEVLMEQQYSIFTEKQEALIGKTVECVVEDYDGYSDSYSGRTWMDAPEIDSAIRFISPKELNIGDFVKVKITNTNEYDLLGEAVR